MNNRQLGRLGEDLAAAYFAGRGYRILCRNYCCKFGEIDLIISRNYALIFVEVKTRRGDFYGTPSEGITNRKKGHMRAAAKHYLNSRPKGSMCPQELRFDAMEVQLNHIENIL